MSTIIIDVFALLSSVVNLFAFSRCNFQIPDVNISIIVKWIHLRHHDNKPWRSQCTRDLEVIISKCFLFKTVNFKRNDSAFCLLKPLLFLTRGLYVLLLSLFFNRLSGVSVYLCYQLHCLPLSDINQPCRLQQQPSTTLALTVCGPFAKARRSQKQNVYFLNFDWERPL